MKLPLLQGNDSSGSIDSPQIISAQRGAYLCSLLIRINRENKETRTVRLDGVQVHDRGSCKKWLFHYDAVFLLNCGPL
ncbi:hypothetical protein K1719_008477 [Acacia pycnantha]|nr:hypothetical protein K1719_008477 [Acacia pycnantha]